MLNTKSSGYKEACFFWTVSISHQLFFKMNLHFAGTQNINTIMLNDYDWLLLVPISLQLIFNLVACLEGYLKGVMF